MQSGARRNVAVLVAVVALLGGVAGTLLVHRFRDREQRRLADQLSSNARALAAGALQSRLKLIEAQAMAAAQLPQIRGQIVTFDAATLQDGFRSESWWAP